MCSTLETPPPCFELAILDAHQPGQRRYFRERDRAVRFACRVVARGGEATVTDCLTGRVLAYDAQGAIPLMTIK